MVSWSSDQCPDDINEGNTTTTDGSTSYTIDDLRGGTSYNITVTAINEAGKSGDNIIVQTLERGKHFAC